MVQLVAQQDQQEHYCRPDPQSDDQSEREVELSRRASHCRAPFPWRTTGEAGRHLHFRVSAFPGAVTDLDALSAELLAVVVTRTSGPCEASSSGVKTPQGRPLALGDDRGVTAGAFLDEVRRFPILVQYLKPIRYGPAGGGAGRGVYRMGRADRGGPGQPEDPIGTLG